MIIIMKMNATQEQIEAGVYEPDKETKEKIKELLTFDNLPTKAEIEEKEINGKIQKVSYFKFEGFVEA